MEAVVNSSHNKPDLLAAEVINLRKVVEKKEAELETKSNQLNKKEQKIEQLLDYIALLRQKRFGRSTEKTSPDQGKLFDEGELGQLLVDLDETTAKEASTENAMLAAKTNTQKKSPFVARYPKTLSG